MLSSSLATGLELLERFQRILPCLSLETQRTHRERSLGAFLLLLIIIEMRLDSRCTTCRCCTDTTTVNKGAWSSHDRWLVGANQEPDYFAKCQLCVLQ